jgi:hypothetical protein
VTRSCAGGRVVLVQTASGAPSAGQTSDGLIGRSGVRCRPTSAAGRRRLYACNVRVMVGAAVGACAAVFSWRTALFVSRSHQSWSLAVLGPVVVAVALATVLIGAIAASRVLSNWPGARHMGRAAMIATGLALLAATPVGFAYDDGCNDHHGQAAVAAAPLLALVRPSDGGGSYESLETLVVCRHTDRPIRLPLRRSAASASRRIGRRRA